MKILEKLSVYCKIREFQKREAMATILCKEWWKSRPQRSADRRFWRRNQSHPWSGHGQTAHLQQVLWCCIRPWQSQTNKYSLYSMHMATGSPCSLLYMRCDLEMWSNSGIIRISRAATFLINCSRLTTNELTSSKRPTIAVVQQNVYKGLNEYPKCIWGKQVWKLLT